MARAEPLPYRLDYQLEVDEDWISRELRVTARGQWLERRLALCHDGAGGWSADLSHAGLVS